MVTPAITRAWSPALLLGALTRLRAGAGLVHDPNGLASLAITGMQVLDAAPPVLLEAQTLEGPVHSACAIWCD